VVGPVGWRLLGPWASSSERARLVVALGAFTYVPKLIGYGGKVAFFDEIGHLAQTERLVEDGLLFVRNSQIVVISDYPGLHTLAAGVHHATGIPLVGVAHLLLATMHVLALIGVFRIVASVGGDARASGIAALMYAIGPGFWFFNAQFAYESFALILFIWILLGVLHAAGSPHRPDARLGGVVAAVMIVTITATHHLTSYVLIVTLGVFVLAALVQRRRVPTSTRSLAIVLLSLIAVTAINAAWFTTQAPTTQAYISPYVADSASDFVSLVSGLGDSGPSDDADDAESRSLFAGSTLPVYEIILGLASPILLFALTAVSMIRGRRVLTASAGALGFAMLAVGYFGVLPLVFSEAGAEIARRSWSFTGVGVAVVVGLGLGVSTGPGATRSSGLDRSARRRVGVLGLVVSVLVGNMATGINEVYRFPGPFVYGSDTRSATAEVKDAAAWFRDSYGENQGVVAERTVLLLFGSDARARWALPNAENAQWDIVLAEEGPSRELLEGLAADGINWIVIDRRQAEFLPLIGFYVDQNEPLSRERTEPLGDATVTKFLTAPLLTKVFASTNYDVYRIASEVVDR